ncbi:DUF3347 domain-containing protein [Zeaxanthinibacter enoshimensis]|uniref:DUF3347 domain-containing protein n=1 Tax=Zeaxanthinibacter enoshimensis TaxID=392009 RepID=UPI003569AEB2
MRMNFAITAILLTLSITACKNEKKQQQVEMNSPAEVKKEEKKTADIADQDFIDGMTGKVWHNYLQTRMALTKDDAEGAATAAANMAEGFGEEKPGLRELAESIAKAEDINKQRELFSELTKETGDLFSEALSGGTIYKQYCPMAFNNTGAYWYSDVPEIRNPYFGSKMLKCGEVKDTIRPKK